MQTFDYILSIILLLGAFLAFFLALVIFKIKYGNLKANKLVSLFCISTTAFLIRGLLLSSGLYNRFPLVTELLDNMRYFWGPSLYLYVKVIFDPDLRFKKYDIIHLLPVTLNIIIKSKIYFSPAEYQVQYLTHWLDGSLVCPEMIWDTLSRIIFYICFGFYIISSIRFHRKFKEKILESSPFGKIYLSWIRTFTYSLFPGLVLWLLFGIVIILGNPLRYFFFSLNLFISFLVFFCVLKILMQPEILYMAKPLKSKKKYDASYLSSRDADIYLDKIKWMMEQDQIYLDPDLDLTRLAEKLTIPKNYLSQIINEKTGKTFNDLINFYRIEKIKELLKDPARKEETVLTLAFEVGFNSKAPFNKAFKKCTGESPITFRKKHIT
jgi:AraC-like DNA-binding protein